MLATPSFWRRILIGRVRWLDDNFVGWLSEHSARLLYFLAVSL